MENSPPKFREVLFSSSTCLIAGHSSSRSSKFLFNFCTPPSVHILNFLEDTRINEHLELPQVSPLDIFLQLSEETPHAEDGFDYQPCLRVHKNVRRKETKQQNTIPLTKLTSSFATHFRAFDINNQKVNFLFGDDNRPVFDRLIYVRGENKYQKLVQCCVPII
jgi:hypothetical protein